MANPDPITHPDTEELPLRDVTAGVPALKGTDGLGDSVDPATLHAWTDEYLSERTYATTLEVLRAAFQFGVHAESRYPAKAFVDAEPELRADWTSTNDQSVWDNVRDAVWAGFDRARDRRV